MDTESLSAFIERLPELDGRLRAIGISRGPQVWLAAYDLLLVMANQGRLPDDAAELAPLLGPILCKSREDQACFGKLYREWLDEFPSQKTSRTQAGKRRGYHFFAAAFNCIRNRLRQVALMAVMMLTLLLPGNVSPPDQEIIPTSTSLGNTLSPLELPIIVNRLPKPVPPEVLKRLNRYETALFNTPWLVLILWLLWRYWPRRVLRREFVDDEVKLIRLDLVPRSSHPFSGSYNEAILRRLKLPHWLPTRKLDAEATAEATARQGGWFAPRYRQRRLEPEYLLLIHSQHRDDQAAALAEELARRFQSVGIRLYSYRFRDGPDRVVRWDGRTGLSLSLAQLMALHGDARLLVVSEFGVLFHPLTGRPRPWLGELSHWARRAWLNPGEADAIAAHCLWREGFLLLPLGMDGLARLGRWLETWPLPPTSPTREQPKTESVSAFRTFPPSLARHADAWLDPQPPYAASLDALFQELTVFLGADGLLLLQALAVYPEPLWNLSLALECSLFPSADPKTRESRLLRLARLPWLRQAYMPEWLRLALLRRLSSQQRVRIRAIYAGLIGHAPNSGDEAWLGVSIASHTRRRWVAGLFRSRRAAGQRDDLIFANIMLGEGLDWLDFSLPRQAERLLPAGRWVVVAFAPAILGWALAMLAMGGLETGWERFGREAVLARLQTPSASTAETNCQRLQQLEHALAGKPASEIAALRQQIEQYTGLPECLAMVKIPAGDFMMGSDASDTEAFDDEKPRHKVAVTAFSLGKYEVTKAQFAAFADATGYQAKGCYAWDGKSWTEQADKSWRDPGFPQADNHPVACVSFDDAQAYIQWLNEKTGVRYRLPTEAEWEYAAWAGTDTRRYWGDNPDAACQYANVADQAAKKTFDWFMIHQCNDGFVYTAPVGHFQANRFGLQDMLGNVWEWTCSPWTDKYEDKPDGKENTCTNDAKVSRAVRGGSWYIGPRVVRSAYRYWNDPAFRYFDLGFRLVQD